jgi:hypothetical protein
MLNQVTVKNCGSGIDANGVRIIGQDVRLENCGTGIRAKNSEIDITNLRIE